ncbi:hypothetical protein SAMN02745126_05728 [Enhydrobacter aerosaccus]|uniref:DUF5666 domain-containing protein n=1 Tax=Enhydrobacter aerosaccus TaxID=225324 RepID=A0A1T4T6F8_9HYPH|nr:hypothetical protein SAMN02745126_05728 [Enhydrobacter aerosaccus]
MAQETLRLRGTIESVSEPGNFIVKSREGETVKVVMTEKPIYTAMVKASLADIKPGQFVGATALPDSSGTLKAVEVHIFPEAMRGTGEGHRPWDLKPESTMTNASVEQSVTSVDGRTLTLKYKGGEKKIVVTPETVVVTYDMGNAAELKPGVGIFISAGKKMADGSISTPRITYGRNGLIPPM